MSYASSGCISRVRCSQNKSHAQQTTRWVDQKVTAQPSVKPYCRGQRQAGRYRLIVYAKSRSTRLALYGGRQRRTANLDRGWTHINHAHVDSYNICTKKMDTCSERAGEVVRGGATPASASDKGERRAERDAGTSEVAADDRRLTETITRRCSLPSHVSNNQTSIALLIIESIKVQSALQFRNMFPAK